MSENALPRWADAYFEWFFTPSMDRDPRTITDFCVMQGIHRADVTRLENTPEWSAFVTKHTNRGGFTSHQAAQVRDAMLTAALTPGNQQVKAQEIVLKMTGDFVPNEKREITTAPADVQSLSQEQLIELVASLTASKAEAFANGSNPTTKE